MLTGICLSVLHLSVRGKRCKHLYTGGKINIAAWQQTTLLFSVILTLSYENQIKNYFQMGSGSMTTSLDSYLSKYNVIINNSSVKRTKDFYYRPGCLHQRRSWQWHRCSLYCLGVSSDLCRRSWMLRSMAFWRGCFRLERSYWPPRYKVIV